MSGRIAPFRRPGLERELGEDRIVASGLRMPCATGVTYLAESGERFGLDQPLALGADEQVGAPHHPEERPVEEPAGERGTQPYRTLGGADGGEERDAGPVELHHADDLVVRDPRPRNRSHEVRVALHQLVVLALFAFAAVRDDLPRNARSSSGIVLELLADEVRIGGPDDGSALRVQVGAQHVGQLRDVPDQLAPFRRRRLLHLGKERTPVLDLDHALDELVREPRFLLQQAPGESPTAASPRSR